MTQMPSAGSPFRVRAVPTGSAAFLPGLERATDAPPSSLFICHPFLANRLILKNIPQFLPAEVFRKRTVESCMKTKTLLGLAAVLAVTGFAASAQAGVSVSVSFGAPVYFAAPVVVAAPRYVPPVAYCPPPVVYYPSPVRYCAPPIVYVPPRYVRHHGYADYRGHNRGHGNHGHGQGNGHGRR